MARRLPTALARRSGREMIKELFLCHQATWAVEVHALAAQLRMRGIAPWVDKQRGGFLLGDSSQDEARRVIQDDCFGLLLYVTPGVFARWFIREVEIPAAKAAKAQHPGFVLSAFLRGTTFRTLARRSVGSFGVDLAEFHGMTSRRNVTSAQLAEDWVRASNEVLRKWLALQRITPRISLQFSTRQLFPDESDDLLRIDATAYFQADPLAMDKWDTLHRALTDVQIEITHSFGRPRLYVHGSKHLTAACLFGRVFARNILDIRQTPDDVWSSDTITSAIEPFTATLDVPPDHDRSLFVEIASRYKNVGIGVDEVLHRRAGANPARLSLTPADGPLDVDNQLCVAMVNQAYAAIEQAMALAPFQAIHLFVASPQAFVMMLAQRFSGLPEVHFYEWTNGRYIKTCVIPSGPAGAS